MYYSHIGSLPKINVSYPACRLSGFTAKRIMTCLNMINVLETKVLENVDIKANYELERLCYYLQNNVC